MGKAVFSSEKMREVRNSAITRLSEDGFRSELYRIKPLFDALKESETLDTTQALSKLIISANVDAEGAGIEMALIVATAIEIMEPVLRRVELELVD